MNRDESQIRTKRAPCRCREVICCARDEALDHRRVEHHLWFHLESDTGREADEPCGGVTENLRPSRCRWPRPDHRITDEARLLAYLRRVSGGDGPFPCGARVSAVHTVFILRGVPAMVDPTMRGYVGDS